MAIEQQKGTHMSDFDGIDGNGENDDTWISVKKLSRDLAKAAATMSVAEVRFLVDNYYAMQKNRMRAAGQERSMPGEPHETLTHLKEQSQTLEKQTQRALQSYVQAHPIGEWLMSIVGIGPVISAGLLAHIDITKAPTVGHIWAFAGLDPTKKWEKGQKRPYNVALKTICWKAGQSFMKNANREGCFYGKLYQERKAQEVKKNDAGDFAEIAKNILATKNFKKDTEAYKWYITGKLPPAHIDARARRWAVKLFLAHFHEELYKKHYKKMPPLPYPIAHLGHAHVIVNPNPTSPTA